MVVIDYGYHSSLVLPRPEGGSVEYAYGEWDWFALNRDEWFHVFATLCCPNTGALGRRRLAAPPTIPALREIVRCEEMLEFRVARPRADGLLRRLEEDFQRRIETRVYNPAVQLEFVHSDVDYCFLVNCNHMLGRWLLELGCGLGGCASFSTFRLERQ